MTFLEKKLAASVNQEERVSSISWIEKIPVSVLTEREVFAKAKLDSEPTLYSFEAVFRTTATVTQLNAVLRDYSGLQNWIPYLQRSIYHKENQTLSVRGGLWGWILESLLEIKEVSPDLLQFEIIRGHLKGLKGKVEYQPVKSHPQGFKLARGEGLFVRISGERVGGDYPPRWIMERGAEFALTVGGKKVRTEIENRAELTDQKNRMIERPKEIGPSEKENKKGNQDEPEYPKPQKHL